MLGRGCERTCPTKIPFIFPVFRVVLGGFCPFQGSCACRPVGLRCLSAWVVVALSLVAVDVGVCSVRRSPGMVDLPGELSCRFSPPCPFDGDENLSSTSLPCGVRTSIRLLLVAIFAVTSRMSKRKKFLLVVLALPASPSSSSSPGRGFPTLALIVLASFVVGFRCKDAKCTDSGTLPCCSGMPAPPVRKFWFCAVFVP